ncbi:hypothetical protein [Aporhodopirellula aestuarii]|uniref:Uncharacterized protein n=1 Tax=Aporhodopirellula aestuarii TaxID=2950107 RepID=A0ABT0UE33_9BACT|nr:hypothetical protein [Aporhodopirellula aestuarii]MCM2375091.1 hypothetical protein [Aporhodopirellula aestuarii]
MSARPRSTQLEADFGDEHSHSILDDARDDWFAPYERQRDEAEELRPTDDILWHENALASLRLLSAILNDRDCISADATTGQHERLNLFGA